MTKTSKTLFAVALFSMLLVAGPASAVEVGLHAGVGPRFSARGVDAVGAIHLNAEVTTMLHLTLDVHSYFGGATAADFAGGDLGLLFQPPIPGPIGLQLGVLGTFTKRYQERHGAHDWMVGFAAEGAVTGTYKVFQVRVTYQHVLVGTGDNDGTYQGQLMIMLGAKL